MNKVLLRIKLDRETERQCKYCTKTGGCTIKENMKSMNMLINTHNKNVLKYLMMETRLKYLSFLEGKCDSWEKK